MIPKAPHNDNAFDPDVIEWLHIECRRFDVEEASKQYRGCSDLLELALDVQKVMRETHEQLCRLSTRKKASMSQSGRALISRALSGVMARHIVASDKFDAIEAAMNDETRTVLWQQIEAMNAEQR